MSNGKHKLDRDELQAFLLGELEEAETSRIEEMFLADGGLEEALEEAKRDLFAAYSSGALSPERSGRFEARFLHAELADDKKAFKAMMERNERERQAATDDEDEGKRSNVPAKTKPRSAAPPASAIDAPTAQAPIDSSASHGGSKSGGARLWVVLALLLVLAAGGGVFLAMQGRGKGESVHEVELVGFHLRGKSQVAQLPEVDRVRVRLQLLAADGLSELSLRLFLHEGEDDSRVVQAKVSEDGWAHAELDLSGLAKGRYDLELSGVREGAPFVIAYYSIRR